MATRIEATVLPDGETEVVERELTPEEEGKLNNMVAGVETEMSAARRRLMQAKHSQPRIEEVEIGEEKYYVRTLNSTKVTRVHLMASRNGDGALDIAKDDDDLRAFSIAVLEGCVVTGKDDLSQYFTLQEAAEWVDSTDPELSAIVDILVTVALNLNPFLTPKKMVGASLPARSEDASTTDK